MVFYIYAIIEKDMVLFIGKSTRTPGSFLSSLRHQKEGLIAKYLATSPDCFVKVLGTFIKKSTALQARNEFIHQLKPGLNMVV